MLLVPRPVRVQAARECEERECRVAGLFAQNGYSLFVHKRGLVPTVLAFGLLVAGAGCGSDSNAAPPGSAADSSVAAAPAPTSPPPITTATPSASPAAASPSPSGPPPEPAIYCRTSELTITAGHSEAGLGHQGLPLRFTNRSDRSCVLEGYPGVAGLDSAGHQVVQAERTQRGYLGGQKFDGPPPTVHLRPGQGGAAYIEGISAPADGASDCPDLPRLLVTPPGETHSVVLQVGVPGCSHLQVHPVLTGAAGTAG